jgi:hypothetical protein
MTAYIPVPASILEQFKASGAQLDSYTDQPTRLEMAISLFTRTGTSEFSGSVHARSIRIPSTENVTIDALAKYSGLSANKVICQLLEVALDEVFQGFSEDQRAQVFAIRGDMMKAVADKEGYPVFPGAENAVEGEV